VTNARFHGEARLEFLDGVAYYESIQVGLGARFRQSVEAAVELAASLPFAGSPHKHGTRRVFPKKFPFSVVYLIGEKKLSYLPSRISSASRDIGKAVGMTVNL
jgi:toxin ParE1/3/4